ncbi:MAG: hypothetical protein WA634_16980 [Silvibacterium sp.]
MRKEKIFLLFRSWAGWLLGVQIAASVAIAATSHYSWMNYVRDDFFYYLIVAQNVASGHGSTFNRIVPTNGYHPLWMLILAAFSLFTTNGTAILIFLGVACLIASVACFFWGREILEISGVDRLVSAPLALWGAVFCCRKFYTGMEVVIATPLAFLLILHVLRGKCMATSQKAFGTGILSSLLMLARLDAGFLVGLLGLGIMLDREYRQQISPRRILLFTAGLVPFFVYLAINKIKFGLLLPVSGMAKQLKPHSKFSWATWRGVIHISNMLNKEQLQICFILATTIVILIAFRRLRGTAKVVFPAVVLFPVVYFTLLSFLSDWVLSDWYMYVMRPAMCISVAFWFSREPMRTWSRSALLPAALIIACPFLLASNTWNAQNNYYRDTVALQKFAQSNPGIYAMGDYAGERGYKMERPIIQTEGLMMDRNFLQKIKQQDNLLSVLHAYHVRYYIANTKSGYTGCFQAEEPRDTGPASPKMRAVFCQKPVSSLNDPANNFVIFDLAENDR